MSTLSLTVALESGSLVFAAPSTGRWVDTLTRASKTWRRTRVASPFAHGSVQTHATLEDSSLEAVVYVEASSAATLEAARDSVEAAFFQWSYELTVTEDGVATTYTCDAADLTWNAHDSGMADRLISSATVTIPCYPVPS